MYRKRLPETLVILAIVFIIAPSVALGATGLETIVTCGNPGQAACNVCDLAKLANNILNDAIYIAVFLSAVLFAFAGFKYLTNMANPGEITRAKQIFFDVAVGLVIILVSWLVVDIVMRTLVGASILPWNSIC